jgi:hypothetical protein
MSANQNPTIGACNCGCDCQPVCECSPSCAARCGNCQG